MNDEPQWMQDAKRSVFVKEYHMARILGLPSSWLKNHAEAGNIPYVKSGKMRMYDHATVIALIRSWPKGTNP